MGISYAEAVKRQARDNQKKTAEIVRTNAATTAATKETKEARSSEMIESQIKAKQTTTTTAGKRYREKSENSQQQPTKINRKGAMQYDSSNDSSGDEGRLVIDEAQDIEIFQKPPNNKALAAKGMTKLKSSKKKQTN